MLDHPSAEYQQDLYTLHPSLSFYFEQCTFHARLTGLLWCIDGHVG